MQTLRIVETSGGSPTLDDFSFDRQKSLADAVHSLFCYLELGVA